MTRQQGSAGRAGALEGEVALITGGASGLGRGVVERFVEEGCKVMVADINGAKLAELKAALGDAVSTLEADLTSPEANERAVRETVAAYGKLDVFVPNAGIFDGFAEFADMSTDQLIKGYELLFGVNVRAVLLGAKAALPELLKTRGSIVMTLSGSSIYPDGGGVLYVASKHAAHGVMRQLAHELAPAIRVNGIAPGVTRTSLHTPAVFNVQPLAASQEELDKWIEDLTPLALHSEPEDHAGAYVLLASRRDGRMITGTVIKTDGGFDIRGLRRTRGGDRLLQGVAQ
jgi:NAD(P)-dependent dehydrogenase (short-subunit alcohol dehydrogenase family)